jgi:hypothetical protein
VVLDTLVVFQTTVDLPGLPATLVVADISEGVEVALVEFDAAIPAVGDIRLAPEVGRDLTRGGVVIADC